MNEWMNEYRCADDPSRHYTWFLSSLSCMQGSNFSNRVHVTIGGHVARVVETRPSLLTCKVPCRTDLSQDTCVDVVVSNIVPLGADGSATLWPSKKGSQQNRTFDESSDVKPRNQLLEAPQRLRFTYLVAWQTETQCESAFAMNAMFQSVVQYQQISPARKQTKNIVALSKGPSERSQKACFAKEGIRALK